jgi:hypothetical protein
MGVELNTQNTTKKYFTPGCCAFLSYVKNQFIEFVKSIFCCFSWARATPPKNISSAEFPSETNAQQQKVETVKNEILPPVRSEPLQAHKKPATLAEIIKYRTQLATHYASLLGNKYSDFNLAVQTFAHSPTEENLDKVKAIRKEIEKKNDISLESYSYNDPKHIILFEKCMVDTVAIETILDECIKKISERFS